MNEAITVNTSLIRQWISNNLDLSSIEKELQSLGHDSSSIEAYILEYKKLKHNKRLSMGFTMLVAGAVLGFISCVLTLLNPVPSLYYWILYGVTSTAVLLISWGLYYVFE